MTNVKCILKKFRYKVETKNEPVIKSTDGKKEERKKVQKK